MSKNPHGGISRKSASREWGSKARKHETTDRNLNRRAANEAIAEQMPAYPERANYGCVDCGSINHTSGNFALCSVAQERHQHTWRYEDSYDAFRCTVCNVWESAD
jgi:hypothetical protein